MQLLQIVIPLQGVIKLAGYFVTQSQELFFALFCNTKSSVILRVTVIPCGKDRAIRRSMVGLLARPWYGRASSSAVVQFHSISIFSISRSLGPRSGLLVSAPSRTRLIVLTGIGGDLIYRPWILSVPDPFGIRIYNPKYGWTHDGIETR